MRTLLLVLLAVGLMLIGPLFPLVGPRHCPVSRTACEQIKTGMTLVEVEAILGGSPGDYLTRPRPLYGFRGEIPDDSVLVQWHGDEGTARVFCSRCGKVQRAWFAEYVPYNASPVEVICWRLERLAERLRR
jgi:hypothetical protein